MKSMQTSNQPNQWCEYYQALVNKERCWYVTGILRSFEHLMFDRTLEKETTCLEFFVPPLNEPQFLILMQYLHEQGLVTELKKLPNRFSQITAQ